MNIASCARDSWVGLTLGVAMAIGLGACRANDLLSSPVPTTVIDPSSLKGRQGAEALRAGVIIQFNLAFAGGGRAPGIAVESGLLGDEFTNVPTPFGGPPDPADRRLEPDNLIVTYRGSDGAVTALQTARLQAELAIPVFRAATFKPPRWEIAQLFAMDGYTELLIAEDYCAGIPLSTTDAAGHIKYGIPLPADSVFARAVALFDSALHYATDSAPVAGLASVGQARALLDLGDLAGADAALAHAPPSFVYTADFDPSRDPSVYSQLGAGTRAFTMSDREGGNGLPFRSSGDPRTPYSVNPSPFGPDTVDLPLAFGPDGTPVPIASSVEAQLIRAEAALSRGDVTAWLDTLNALRGGEGGVQGLAPLSDPGTPAARVDTMFTERAYWLFGTAHRLGDLRRLIRQYGRQPETVFPTGPYSGPRGGAYGTDVNFPFPVDERNNPHFHGCLNRAA